MIKLQSFEDRGHATLYINNTFPIPGGSVTFHRPFVALGGGAAITPEISVDGMTVVTRLDYWHPMQLSDDGKCVVLPMQGDTQEAAAAAARAFVADPATSVDFGDEAQLAWCSRYVDDLQSWKG